MPEVPPTSVTDTLTVLRPVVLAGADAVMVVELTTVTPVAWLAPNATVVGPANPLPVMVTTVPPATGPALGLRALMVGTPT